MAILNFMLTLPGKEKKQTYFVDKIVDSLIGRTTSENPIVDYTLHKDWYHSLISQKFVNAAPKRHTIRHDQLNRWKVGMMIDFFINARTKKMFRFAPRVPVKSLQTITFSWSNRKPGFHLIGTPVDRICIIHIDGRFYGDAYFYQGELKSGTYTLEQLAINDGFDTVQEFFDWFKEDFSGKIIHWTDLKY